MAFPSSRPNRCTVTREDLARYMSIYLSIYLSLFIYLFIFSLVDGVVQVVAEGEGEIGTNAATESGQIIEKNIRIERGALLKKIN